MTIEEIKKYMKDKGIKQKELAKKSGISINTLRSIFSNRRKNPRIDTINAICNALGIDNSLPTQPTLLNGNFRLGIKNKIVVFDNSGDKYEFDFNKEELNKVLKICEAISKEKE